MRIILVFLSTVFILAFDHESLGQKKEIIEDLNLENFNSDFSNYHQLTATYLAQVSEVVYWKKTKIDQFCSELNKCYPNAHYQYDFLEDKNNHSQALLLGTDHFLIIAFRGTEPSKIKDWITDVKFWNYENTDDSNEALGNMPAGHGGFRKSLIGLITKEDLFNKIDQLINKCSNASNKTNFPIYLTGHSLGAAMSQLFIEPLDYKGYNFQGAYHFAPPLAVTCSLNAIMKEKFGAKVYDIVNYKDYVPRAGRNGVAHFGKFYRICKDGLIYSEVESYTKFRRLESLQALKYHKLGNHLKAIKNQINTAKSIKERSDEEYPCVKPKNEVLPCK
ncbi:MAG: lipase family protein [Flavobacteriales bacterium]|jgi:hypothetical protein|nr:lipase family protein [Flavobacteriales bacterium]